VTKCIKYLWQKLWIGPHYSVPPSSLIVEWLILSLHIATWKKDFIFHPLLHLSVMRWLIYVQWDNVGKAWNWRQPPPNCKQRTKFCFVPCKFRSRFPQSLIWDHSLSLYLDCSFVRLWDQGYRYTMPRFLATQLWVI
jgi:hypothetical protein